MGFVPEYEEYKEQISEFLASYILPYAEKCEKQKFVDRSLFEKIAGEGFLGANVPKKYGGSELSMLQIGILSEEFAKASSSIRSIFTVQGMVQLAVLRWGSEKQKKKWLPEFSGGRLISAFALAEEQAGCDAGNLEAEIKKENDCFVLNGRKTWVTLGMTADVYLVFAKYEGNIVGVLVENDKTIKRQPIEGLLGVRASMVGNITFNNTKVPLENMIGSAEAGLKFIIPSCLDYGRYTIAWTSLGISEACVSLCREYASERKQFGKSIKEYQLVQEMLTKMIVLTRASETYCKEVAEIREKCEPNSILETMSLKYFSTKVASKVTNLAVQLFGANGCCDKYPIERYFRDARINEIIEGSSQMHEIIICLLYTTPSPLD